MSTGCKCPPGFKGDGLTCEGKASQESCPESLAIFH